jgi:uncharacterized protein (TIGR03437 family)
VRFAPWVRTSAFLFIAALLPFVVSPFAAKAYEYGPDPRYTGAPGDNKTACVSAGCHQGTVNSGGGSVKIIVPNGTTYTPGQAMTISVQITDSTKVKYGFELTARLASNTSGGQAGDFTTGSDGFTQVLCDDGSVKSNGKACPSQFPVQFIEHTLAGYQASTKGGFTFTFTWTPPAATAGSVILYAAGNAGPGNPPVATPTNVYTTNITLTPGASTPTPSISNVQNGASFQSTLAASTYATITGQNLSTNTTGRTWAGSDFTQNSNGTLNAPTSLDGTSVTVGGVSAYIYYVSPTQLNIITPPSQAAGNGVPVVVSVNGQQSSVFSATLQNLAPAFFEWFPGTADNGQYLVATHADGTFLGKVGLYPNTPANFTTPARPQETIILYGTGFGTTSPPIGAGIVTDKLYSLSPTPTATVGNIPATVAFAGLAGSFFQVFQFNIIVPPSAPNGDLPLVVTVNGTQSFTGLITVQN